MIPDGWSKACLGDCLSIEHGRNQAQVADPNGRFPILGSGGEIGRTDAFLHEGPSVLIGRKGTIDRPQYIDSPFWTVDTLFYSRIRDGYLPKFIYYYFFMVNWRSFNEASGVPSLNASTIEGIEIAVPPLAEQQAIADALSDADALVEALDALIAKKRDMKHAAMQQLLTGRTRLPGYTDEWEEVRLGELLDYEQPTKYLVNGGEYQDSGSIPVLTAGKSFLLGYTSDTEGVYDKGPTILFDDFTTATQWVEFPFKVKSSACKMLTSRRPEVSLRFVYELMRTISYVPTDHMRHWIGIASEWPVIAPQSDEQQAIAEVLSDMDAEIVALVAQREKAELIEQGMMQELLSGRIRLV
jgi:type I restriction enzyme S subunit